MDQDIEDNFWKFGLYPKKNRGEPPHQIDIRLRSDIRISFMMRAYS